LGFVAGDVVGGERDAHEEETKLDILMLIGVENIGVVLLHQKVGNGGDETFAVGTVDEKNGGFGHGSNLIRAFFKEAATINASGRIGNGKEESGSSFGLQPELEWRDLGVGPFKLEFLEDYQAMR
jgi:hypothetical protein